MREKWKAHVAVIMRLICEQNDIPAIDMPEVPDDLYDGTGLTDRGRMIDTAYKLLIAAGKVDLKDQKGGENAKEE